MPAVEQLHDHVATAETVEVAPRLAARGLSLTLSGRVVLDDVTFQVAPGEVFGVLGPNGAGKTSLMRCLTGLVRPDLGVLWYDGKELNNRSRALRGKVGVVFQEPSLDHQLTARENLLLGAALFNVRGEEATTRTRELLDFMQLADRADEYVEHLSGGMRRRLEIARALIHKPDLLLMDEPTSGLDMQAFERLWGTLFALRKLHGLTIVLNTRSPDEAQKCDRLLVIDRGHVVTVATPLSLLARVRGDVLTIVTAAPDDVIASLSRDFDLTGARAGDDVVVHGERLHELVPRLVEGLLPGLVRSIDVRRPSLADAFLDITGRPLADTRETP